MRSTPFLLRQRGVDKNARRERICLNVARILREERETKRLSLNELAGKAGLSRQMVTFVERGERNPSLDTLLRLAEALGLELDEILRKARN